MVHLNQTTENDFWSMTNFPDFYFIPIHNIWKNIKHWINLVVVFEGMNIMFSQPLIKNVWNPTVFNIYGGTMEQGYDRPAVFVYFDRSARQLVADLAFVPGPDISIYLGKMRNGIVQIIWRFLEKYRSLGQCIALP